MALPYTSLRGWLEQLESRGQLAHIRKKVDTRFEISALGKQAMGKCGLVFHNVGGSMPVVTAMTGSREMFADALGVEKGELSAHFARAQDNPVPWTLVDGASAPVKEVVERNVDLGKLPIPVHHEKDSGAYVTAGVLIARHPETGELNMSIHRLQVSGPNRFGILVLPRHLAHFHRIAEDLGKPLDVAVAIGLDPVLMLCSQAICPLGFDEFTIAGALYGKPLEMVKCETVDIEVPAQAEIVLEGRLLPGVREMEGPFGEYPRYYGPPQEREVIDLTCMTSRRKPYYQTIIPATAEHLLLGSIPREGGMLRMIANAVPTVRGVHLTHGGTGRYHVVVGIDKKNEGEGKNAAFAALAGNQEVKHVVVVDKDVDIFNMDEVEWAVATRCQAASDVSIIARACGNRLDPSTDEGVSDKMIIDATVPLDAPEGKFEKISVPGEDDLRLEDYVD